MLTSFRKHSLTATGAAQQLGLSRSRFYTLSTDYLRAYARKKEGLWIPGTSGGDHTSASPEPVTDLLRKCLACSPPCPYSFVASEALRLHSFKLDRAQVRLSAMQNGLAHRTPPERPRSPVRRWQRSQIGELWQLDASPHRWFPNGSLDFPMLNMLDDCSRVFVGSKLYGRELLLSYLDCRASRSCRWKWPVSRSAAVSKASRGASSDFARCGWCSAHTRAPIDNFGMHTLAAAVADGIGALRLTGSS